MATEIRTATHDDWPAMVRADERAFSGDIPVERHAEFGVLLDAGRFSLAVEDGGIVGVAGSIEFRMSVPGGALVPASGITWVSVLPTHRRQGVLTRLMARQHEMAREREEVAAILTASEGTIYGRFGYGPATFSRTVDVKAGRARFRDDAPRGGTVRFVEGDEVSSVVPELFAAYQRSRPGEVDRSQPWWDRWFDDPAHLRGELSRHRILVHRDDRGVVDGYCSYRSAGSPGEDMRLEVMGVVTTDAVAHAELWRTVLSIDLVDTVRTWRLPSDDPLRFLLTDPRALDLGAGGDVLWCAPLDPVALLAARTVGEHDGVVVQVRRAGCVRVEAGATASSTADPDLTLGSAELGSVLLGGVSPQVLARAGRIDEHRPGAVAALTRLLAVDRQPFLSTPF